MRRLLSFAIFAVSFVLVLFFSVTGYAQTFRGAINGSVTDPSGAVVAGASVKAANTATGIVLSTVSTSGGAFAFQDIPTGVYKITVTASGFSTSTVDKVNVVAGTVYTLPVQLKVGLSATVVEVSAAELTVDTTTVTQSDTIPSANLQQIPLNGRDFSQLIAVTPGYGGYSVGGFGSLNGTRANQVNWQVDGTDNNDFWHNIPAINQGGVSGIAGTVLPIDATEEFSVQTSSGPEGGRNAGGTANIVLKSGTNDIHGSLYYYNRNEYFASPSPFFVPAPGTKAPRERNENYGFSAGGPIIKNKTFVFVNYEKNDFVFGLSGIATEPSDAWVTLATDLLNNPVRAPITATCTTRKYGNYNPVTRSAVSTNAIGTSGFWPRSGSSSIAGLSATAGNFFSPSSEFGYSYNGVARVDHQISDKHHLSLHAIIGQGNQTAPLGGSPALGTASSNLAYYFEVAPLHDGNYGAVLNSPLSSRWTNQFLFGASYFNQLFHDNNNGFDTKAMGIFLSTDATAHGQPIHGAPNIIIAPPSKGGSGGFEQIGLTPPEGRSDLTLHFTDIVSYSVGKHQFRYGAEFRHGKLNEFYHRRGTGKFVFDGSFGPWANDPVTATETPLTKALADFLAGDVSSCTDALHVNNSFTCGSTIAVVDPERWVHVNAFNAYIQDWWQLTRKLNISYGLRYEYFGPMQTDKKDIANFVGALNGSGTGFVVQDGSHALFNPGKDHFAPRLGFAYQPTAKGDLVVRGGFGVFYDQINLNPFLDFRPPVSAPSGIQGNPFGATPVSTYSRSGYNWDAVQAGGASIFPGVKGCSNPLCAAAGDPQGLGAYSVSSNFRTPYFYNYNLQVEKSLGNSAIFQIGYVGSQGRKLNIVSDINQAGAFTHFGHILQLNTIGTSNYNALQTIFRTRAWRGLSTQFAYTWSHALDEVSEYRGQVLDDAFNLKADYGNSDFDTRHLFTVSGTYDIG